MARGGSDRSVGRSRIALRYLGGGSLRVFVEPEEAWKQYSRD